MHRWVLLVLYFAGLVALTSCRGETSTFEREAEVQGVADALAEDLGTDIEGDAHHRRTAPGCAAQMGIDESEAWYERNTYSVMDHPGGVDALYPAMVAHFEDRYEAVEP